ncbi:hypothetical protein [Halorussus marinus]|uniref:hypothetical protein n=1 Tax=Halorussus marinus TaxID=2505976 RepID=UPI00106DF3E6|nr:hypothetical protein [Halorussus marinus]
MLTTETYRLSEEIETLADRIDELDDELEDIDESTDQAQAVQARRDRLTYFQRGLRWQRDEQDWGDAAIELGAMTAGEKAMMHREATDGAESEEMRLWFVAASTVDAPYHADDLAETFTRLSNCHPAFTEWAEAQANALGIPAESGNRSSTSSTASNSSGTSTGEPDSTTSSSSDSPTA